MKRRVFIRNTGVASVGIPLTLNGFNVSAISQVPFLEPPDPANDRVLVMVQLLGGNDGLNTVVPVDQYQNLQKARPKVLIPLNKLLNITPTVGFHPSLTGLKGMYDTGTLGIVQSVGYPNQNRSHFRSVDIWRTGADATDVKPTGWAGRYFDTLYPGYPTGYPNSSHPHPIAMAMGSFVSETCQGTAANYSLALSDPFTFSKVHSASSGFEPEGAYGEELRFMREAISNSNAYATSIGQAASAGKNLVSYPDTDIARQLKNVALMISGGMKTKMYVVSQDQFDTHAKQVQAGNPTLGLHANLLKNVSDAIQAFQLDLIAHGLQDRVMGVTLSEFGRQIKSNNSDGTDHGTAAPLILFGSCVKPQILGENPVISSAVADQEGVPMQFDFRDVYGSLLQDWFGADLSTVKSVFHQDFIYHDLISASCKVAPPAPTAARMTKQVVTTASTLSVFPNPATSFATIEFLVNEEQQVQASLFDAGGNQLKIITSRHLPAGKQQIKLDLSAYPKGYYLIRVVSEKNGIQTRSLIKL